MTILEYTKKHWVTAVLSIVTFAVIIASVPYLAQPVLNAVGELHLQTPGSQDFVVAALGVLMSIVRIVIALICIVLASAGLLQWFIDTLSIAWPSVYYAPVVSGVFLRHTSEEVRPVKFKKDKGE